LFIAGALTLAGCWEPGAELLMAPQNTYMSISQQFSYTRGGYIRGSGSVSVSLMDRTGKSSVSGGTVKMNGLELTSDNDGAWSEGYYRGGFDPVSDSLKGPMAVFSVSGSDDFPALTDSIPFPHGPLELQFPGGRDTLPLTGGIAVSWEPKIGDSATLTIVQERDRFGKRSFVQRTVYNGGSITIPSNQHNFIPGPVFVTILRDYWKLDTLPDGRRYRIANMLTNRFNDIILVR
jgi:hypothetical protein